MASECTTITLLSVSMNIVDLLCSTDHRQPSAHTRDLESLSAPQSARPANHSLPKQSFSSSNLSHRSTFFNQSEIPRRIHRDQFEVMEFFISSAALPKLSGRAARTVSHPVRPKRGTIDSITLNRFSPTIPYFDGKERQHNGGGHISAVHSYDSVHDSCSKILTDNTQIPNSTMTNTTLPEEPVYTRPVEKQHTNVRSRQFPCIFPHCDQVYMGNNGIRNWLRHIKSKHAEEYKASFATTTEGKDWGLLKYTPAEGPETESATATEAPRILVCDYRGCGRTFMNHKGWLIHLKKTHAKHERNELIAGRIQWKDARALNYAVRNTVRKSVTCPQCGKAFTMLTAVAKHWEETRCGLGPPKNS
ncbi:hypothetical protein K439DRAFT_1624580 [Ramaria rubella]|nr:hypothetical protein K439DRAFT_1624580 [Ramaria rubella]